MRVAKAWFWSIVMKLSPSRRVVLVLALLLAAIGDFKFGIQSTHIDLDFRPLSFLLLLVLLVLELSDRVTMKRDLQIARDIQRWLSPETPPLVPGVDVSFTTRPANTVSGDYYDAFLLDDEGKRLLLVVADVAGKGVPAAILMASLQGCLHSCARDFAEPLPLVERLNEFTCARSLDGQRFTTAFLAELDVDSRVLRYVNAGFDNTSMALLGLHEHVVARDAHLLNNPFDANAETIPAGATEDAIATMPAGAAPSTHGFPLYNRQLHVTNGDQTAPNPVPATGGGMLTFIHP